MGICPVGNCLLYPNLPLIINTWNYIERNSTPKTSIIFFNCRFSFHVFNPPSEENIKRDFREAKKDLMGGGANSYITRARERSSQSFGRACCENYTRSVYNLPLPPSLFHRCTHSAQCVMPLLVVLFLPFKWSATSIFNTHPHSAPYIILLLAVLVSVRSWTATCIIPCAHMFCHYSPGTDRFLFIWGHSPFNG